MPIEIIPKPAKRVPLWQNVLFYFSIILLLASITYYFILDSSLQASEAENQRLEEELAKGKTPEEIALEEEVFGYEKKIQDFSVLVEGHTYPSKFFTFFEGLCHPSVWFSQSELVLGEDYELSLSGEADNFITLGQQLFIFQQEELIQEVELAKLSLNVGGRVDFSFYLILDHSIIK
jgi:hypothetical protein